MMLYEHEAIAERTITTHENNWTIFNLSFTSKNLFSCTQVFAWIFRFAIASGRNIKMSMSQKSIKSIKKNHLDKISTPTDDHPTYSKILCIYKLCSFYFSLLKLIVESSPFLR